MSLLLRVLREPATVCGLDTERWNLLLRELRAQGLCARLGYLLEDAGVAGCCPPPVWTELCAQRHQIHYIQAQTRLEMHKVAAALSPLRAPVMLLKGAAYAALGLDFSRGRRFADLDIMVPAAFLERAETALSNAGWRSRKLHPYDQRYYRRWMHELPPMQHPAREIELDLHHAILPRTARLKPSTALLWEDARALADTPFLHFSPQDLVLHAASQLCYDSAVAGELSALLDVRDLLAAYQQQDDFWPRLIARAELLDLGRPLFYALHLTADLLGTPIPRAALRACARFAPPTPTRWLMLTAMRRALEPRAPLRRPARLSGALLYARSHWLRMPPWLLARHLLTKALRK